jgi:PKD repeat protein
MKSSILNTLLAFTLIAGLLTAPAAANTVANPAAAPPDQIDVLGKIEPLVLEELHTAGQTDFFVWMAEKADLSPAYNLKTKLEKGEFVFNALRETAERTQKDLRTYLDAQGISYQPFYIANKILVRGGSQTLLMSVAARPDVAQITANHKFQLQEPFINPAAPAVVESNISFVNADDVWALGVTGAGVVLAGNDTGLDEDHPAIARHYRGCLNPPTCSSENHNYNWWDATNTYPTDPWDGHGHGTHTTGTMVGDDGGTNQIGMAPGAQTVHCKNMTDGGSGDDGTFTECFQWDLAPWDLSGLNPDPAMAPDAINNSWGYWGGNAPQFEDEITALQAAGILVEVSAGNEGPSCSTLRSPGDYEQVITTGSVDHIGQTFPGIITNGTWSTSRGPSALYPGDYFPDVMAPGNGINSSLPGGGYSGPTWGGTSMSGPHVTGLVGLMWSANPGLRGQVATTMQLIKETAAPLTGQGGSSCGGDYTTGPNNDWGYGTIDALAAVQAAMTYGGTGTLAGVITEAAPFAAPGDPIADVTIAATLMPTGTLVWETTSGPGGVYSMLVFSGTYTVDASKYGYLPAAIGSVGVISGTTTTLNIALTPAASHVVDGYVTDANTGWPLYARLDIQGYPYGPVWSDPVSGYYSVTLAEGITYTFDVSAWVPGYLAESRDVGPLTGNTTEDFALNADVLSCVAPGYTATTLLDEDFDPDGFPVTWAVLNNGGDCVWRDDNPGARTNNTGGSGLFAIADSDFCGSGSYMDTTLRSPAFNTSAMSSVVLEFKSDYPYLWTALDVLDVDVFNGSVWTNVLRRSGTAYPGPETVQLDITAAAGGSPNARVRFHYYNANYEYWWSVDDVRVLGDCLPPTNGGLVVGNVYDGNIGVPLAGAAIENEDGYATTSAATPDDPAVDEGFYTLFSPAGSKTFTATLTDYGAAVDLVAVALNDAVLHDFNLSAGWLDATPDGLHATVNMGAADSLTLTLDNLGGSAATFELAEVDGGFQPTLVSKAYAPPAISNGAATNLLQYAERHATFGDRLETSNHPLQAILLDQPPNQVNGFFADTGCDLCGGSQSIAENFSLSEAKAIGQIVFWTGYYPGDTPIDPDHITVIFHADAAGLPGAALYTEADLAYERVQTGVFLFGVHEWMHTLTLDSPVILPPGNYWVEIYNDTGFGSDDFFWETGNLDPVNGLVGSAWSTSTPGAAWNYDGTNNLAIQLIEGSADVPWLSESPITGTIPSLLNQVVDVTFDASVPEVTQPGDYYATLNVQNDTPYGTLAVPVTMTVVPPPNWGKLEGTVTSLGYCDANPYALEDAEVFIESNSGMTWTLATDDAGHYIIWLDEGDSPYSVTASFAKHLPATATGVNITGQQTTVVDFDLRELIPCGSVAPDAIEVTVLLGDQETVPLALTNDGAADMTFETHETTRTQPLLLSKWSGIAFSAPAAIGPASVRSSTGRAALALDQIGSPLAWTAAAPLPPGDGVVRYAKAQCADTPDSFYIISGVDESFNITNNVWRYDADTDTWTALAPIPVGQEGPSAVCFEGFIYVFGGGGTNQFYIYDIAGDSWAAGPSLPRLVWGAATGAWDGKVYMIGGDSDFFFGGTSNAVNIYDIAGGAWSTGASMPTPRGTAGHTQIGEYVYVVGGWGDAAPGANAAVAERYNMATDTWESGPAFTTALADGSLAATEAYLYAMGGDANGGGAFDASATVEVLDWTAWPGGSWTDLGDPLPTGVTANNGGFCTEAMAGGEVWSTGGINLGFVVQTANNFRPSEGCATGGLYADVPWLSEDPITGTVPADSVRAVDVTFTALVTLTEQPTYPVFTATLIVQTDDKNAGDNGKLYVPVTMTVSAAPFCRFETNSPVDVGDTVVFTNTTLGDAPIGFEWDFGDGSSSTLVNPTHVYAQSGLYTVTLAADNLIGHGECSQVVEVNGLPNTGFTSNSPIYLGEIAYFTNTTTALPDVIDWLWDFDLADYLTPTPPTSNQENPPPVVYTSAGERMVSLTAFNPYVAGPTGLDTYTAPFVVCSAPLTGASFTYPAAIAGQPVTFTAVLVPADVIPEPVVEWSFGGTGLEATHTFATAGSYSVVMTVTNACDQVVYDEMVTVAAAGPEEFFIYLPVALKNH